MSEGSSSSSAEALWNSGYGRALISIIPPNAPLSPVSMVKPEMRGKIPGRQLSDGWAGFPNWTKYEPTIDDVRKWARWGASFGLRTRNFPFIDVDVESPGVATAIVSALEESRGMSLLRRYGRAPRVAVPFRTDTPFRKVVYTLRDAAGSEAGKVEVSGDGNQMVILGEHPKTGQPYHWQEGQVTGGAELLAAHSADSLPVLDAEHLPALGALIAAAVEPFGLTVGARGTSSARAQASSVDQESLRAPSIALLREVVDKTPNDEHFSDRADYINMLRAIRAAAGEASYAEGLEIAQSWAAAWTESYNDPADVEREYESLKPPSALGWDYIISQAQRAGYNVAALAFSVSPAAENPKAGDRSLTDMGNASRFAATFPDRLLFVGSAWRAWDGRRWASSSDVEILEHAKQVVRDLDDAAAKLKSKKLRLWAEKSKALQRLNAMVTLARGELLLDPGRLDADPWLLTVLNGTVDLRTGQMRAHSPANRITKLVPVEYDANARCPLWLAFLCRIMGNDQQMVDALQRMVGYSLTGLTSEQVFFLLHGVGANGKTTFLEVLRKLFGDYAVQTKYTTLLERRNDSAPRPDIVRLRDARLITASEVPDGAKFDAATVKALTGGDTLTDRNLYEAPVEFQIVGKMWLAANHRPHVDGGDPAMWRRLRLVPFDVTIPEEERDPELIEKLRHELPGILAWAVRGCATWQRDGLSLPPAITAATAAYRAETSAVAAFIAERCEITGDAQTPKQELYDAYVAWCHERSDPLHETIRDFGDKIARHDPARIKSKKSNTMHWVGIRVRQSRLGAEAVRGE